MSSRRELGTMLAIWLIGLSAASVAGEKKSIVGVFRQALTFHASFDESADADFALGDLRVYTDHRNPKPGLHRDDVTIARDEGRYGSALKFTKKKGPAIFYRADKNIPYRAEDWSGTISFWLSLDPDQDLDPGYCDPIQITEKRALDASLFVEFTKDHTPRRFRMAVCPDFAKWNPQNRKWESIPVSERPIVEINNPPFAQGKWTHVVVTFSHFNTGKPNAVAKLYLDGKLQGVVQGRTQTYTWDPSKAQIKLGLSYIGLFDDLAIFNRALSDEEVGSLFHLKRGVGELGR